MTKLKRSLTPIRLAIPSLLALSATAAWTPVTTIAGTGFGAGTNTQVPNAAVLGYYDNVAVPKTLYLWSGYFGSGGGAWTEIEDEIKANIGRSIRVIGGVNNPPIGHAVASRSEVGGSGIGYAAIHE
jgi:hypothetical protein